MSFFHSSKLLCHAWSLLWVKIWIGINFQSTENIMYITVGSILRYKHTRAEYRIRKKIPQTRDWIKATPVPSQQTKYVFNSWFFRYLTPWFSYTQINVRYSYHDCLWPNLIFFYTHECYQETETDAV